MRLRDLRHQQNGQAPQQPERKGQQGQGHSLQVSILGHGGAAAPGIQQIDRQAGGHQHVLRRVERTGKAAPALHGPEDLPQALCRVHGASGRARTECGHRLPPVKQKHQAGRYRLAEGRCRQNGRTLAAHVQRTAPLQREPDGRDADHLLHELAHHVGADLPPGNEKAAQHRRDRHPGQAECRRPQRTGGADIAQPPRCGQLRQTELPRPRSAAQQQRRPQQTEQHPAGLGPAAAHLLGHQAGGRHRDAGRRQRDEERIHRQHQLVQAHPLAAQRIGQPDAQPHPGQPEHHIRPREQGRVLQVARTHRRTSPSSFYYMGTALQNMSRRVGCFSSGFMV